MKQKIIQFAFWKELNRDYADLNIEQKKLKAKMKRNRGVL